jgi:chromosome segregation ATPase
MASEPNFAVIAQCLDGIKNEVGLAPNIIPLTAAMFRQEMQLTLGTIIAELRTEMGTIQAEMGEMRAEIGQLRAEMGQLKVGAGQFRAEVGHLHTQIGLLREEFRER